MKATVAKAAVAQVKPAKNSSGCPRCRRLGPRYNAATERTIAESATGRRLVRFASLEAFLRDLKS